MKRIQTQQRIVIKSQSLNTIPYPKHIKSKGNNNKNKHKTRRRIDTLKDEMFRFSQMVIYCESGHLGSNQKENDRL